MQARHVALSTRYRLGRYRALKRSLARDPSTLYSLSRYIVLVIPVVLHAQQARNQRLNPKVPGSWVKRALSVICLCRVGWLQHYVNRTEDGRVVVWPTQALESFQCVGWNRSEQRPPADCCVDDMPTVAHRDTITAFRSSILTIYYY